MPEYDNQTIMRQEIEHSFDSDNIDWLSIPLEPQKTYASDTNIFEPTSQSLSSPHLPLENATIKNTYGLHTILTSKGSNLIADDDDKKMTVFEYNQITSFTCEYFMSAVGIFYCRIFYRKMGRRKRLTSRFKDIRIGCISFLSFERD